MVEIVHVTEGVDFAPSAAWAFIRATTNVKRQRGYDIDVNSTFRDPVVQLRMYDAWNAWVAGTGPYPGHSKAIHPDYSDHCKGIALDSDDWVNDWVVRELADNGFIRDQLHVPGEQHHFRYFQERDNHFGEPIGQPDVAPAKPAKKETKVKTYHYQDATARKSGRTVRPGGSFYLHTTEGAPISGATNVVGNPGTYSITPHVYATGTPGDVVEIVLLWDATQTEGPHSPHYTERLVIDKDGQLKASREFKRGVAPYDAVYLRATAASTNKGDVKFSVLDADAYLFITA